MLNTEVIAISTDSIYSHKIFMLSSPSSRLINYPLVSDRTGEISTRYGVLNEGEHFAWRGAYIIDPEGNIMAYLVYPQPVGRNIDEIIRIIQALQFVRGRDIGAPAGWVPGMPGIPTGWEYVGMY